MGIPLGELSERMPAEEFMMHWAQYRRQPWGPEREELNTAIIARTVAVSQGRTLKDKNPSVTDWFSYGRPKEEVVVDMDPVEFAKRYG